MEKQVYRISSTALGNSACMLHFDRQVRLGYKVPLMDAKMVYGVAFHKFMEGMYTHADMVRVRKATRAAFDIPKDEDKKSQHYNDFNHLWSVCLTTWEDWALKDPTFEVVAIDGVPLVEQTFELEYYEDDYIKVYLCGTLDTIGKIQGGCYAIRDWKTTSTWDAKSYMHKYDMSRQLRFYRLALRIMHERDPESVLGKIGGQVVGAFIDGVFVKANMNEVTWARSSCYQYSEKSIQLFRNELDEFIQNLSIKYDQAYCHAHGEEVSVEFTKQGLVNGACEGKYGKLCPFFNVCAAPEQHSEMLLKRDFIQVPFNPADYNSLGDV